MLLIKNGYIKPMAGSDIPCGCVLIDDDGKIAAVAAEISAPEGAEVVDAQGRLVTPGCVEAHCHIAISNEAMDWKAITINPAEATGIADRVGSLEAGKDGDVVIWAADPLRTVGTGAYMTIVDGKIVHKA